jgi:biotin carboxyl carrier protein
VSAGQEVCTLEAMKMKNAIRSPREGVVAAVEAQVGQKVAHGAVLVTFE